MSSDLGINSKLSRSPSGSLSPSVPESASIALQNCIDRAEAVKTQVKLGMQTDHRARKRKEILLLDAADKAHKILQFNLQSSLRFEAETPPACIPPELPTIISESEWAAPRTINLPPYPQELIDFLNSDCTIWSGKKRWETHILVPLFPKVSINNVVLPSTLESLDLLDKSSGGTGYGFLGRQVPKNYLAEEEFCYGVMTRDCVPGSRDKSYDDQLGLLPPGYEAPGVFDAARAILWEHRRSGKRYFNNDIPVTFTRCKEIINGYNLTVGGFRPSGLAIDIYRCDSRCLGIAGWKKF